jgi:hypothetical protein
VTPGVTVASEALKTLSEPPHHTEVAFAAPLPGLPGFKAKLVQDAHTVWEQALYDCLWISATGDPNGPKTVCAGYRTLAAQTRLGDKTIKRNLRSLEEKLAIEPIAGENSHTNTGRTYRIYSYKQILDRRRAVGLEWVIRNRQAVILTSAPGATVTTGVNETTEASKPPAVSVSRAPVVRVPMPPGVSVTTHIENSLENKRTTSAARAIVELLYDEIGMADDEAANRIITECRKRAPDATDSEITSQVQTQARRLVKNQRVSNPVGLLIAQVPKYFEGDAFRRIREEQSRELPREVDGNGPDHDDKNYWKELASNPDATEEMRRIAQMQVVQQKVAKS